jgi:hypothetical protein
MAVEPIHEWSWQKCRRDPLLYAGRMCALGLMFTIPGFFLHLVADTAGKIVAGIGSVLLWFAIVLFVWGVARKLQGNYAGS